jgi:hypothetical protein
VSLHAVRRAGLTTLLAATTFVALLPGSAGGAAGTQDLNPNERLNSGQYLTSDHGRYQAIMQGDGNFVLYGDERRVLWSSPTYGHPGAYAIMKSDGVFVIRDAGGNFLWSPNLSNPGYRLHLGEGGDLQILTGSGGQVWHTDTGHDNSDSWNPAGFEKEHECVHLKDGSAPALFEGGGSLGSTYRWMNSQDFQSDCTRSDPVWLDSQEVLTTSESTPRRLYFVHGGPGTVPYGHVWIADLNRAPAPRSSGPPAAGSQGAGEGCTPAANDPTYEMRIDPHGTANSLPDEWQYKVEQTSASYHKYQSAGERQGSLGASLDGPARYGYLTWVWVMRRNRSDEPLANQNPWKTPDQWGNDRVTNTAGGIVRSLIKDRQEFRRCGQIESINGLAWDEGASPSAKPIGRVTAIYGKTRSSTAAPWLYGWVVYSHQCRASTNSDGSYVWGSINDTTHVCTAGGRNLHVY